ncbi:MAG: hypothetical protein KAJ44_01665 [Thermoplasmatales archaeon]|nr:hypothetical protein [Thermoplasmatales archaeon]
MLKEIIKNNDAQGIPFKTLIIFALIIIVMIFVCWWFFLTDVSCNDPIEITGTLMGFEKNESYWNIRIDNSMYLFSRFDRDYLQSMIGFNVSILCCKRERQYKPLIYFDMISCFVCEECDT